MQDLVLAGAVLLVVSAGLLLLAARIGRAGSIPARIAIAAVAIGVLCAYGFALRDHYALSRIFPFSSAIVLANIQVPAAALLAGLAWATVKGNVARRLVLLVPLVGIAIYHASRPILQEPPITRVEWLGDVCLQTSQATCSPAAAATLLRSYGIQADESEMARLCLTSENGTSMLGLFRGLKLKTRDTQWDVQIADYNVDQARATGNAVIATVGLPRNTSDVDIRYEALWGWTPGVSHTVVVFPKLFQTEGVEVGDPAAGREYWSREDMDVLWTGPIVRLVPRD